MGTGKVRIKNPPTNLLNLEKIVLLLKFYQGGLLYFFCQLNVVPSKISSMVFHSSSFSSSVCQVIDTLSTPTTRVTDQRHSVSLQGKGNVLGAGWNASHIALKLSLLALSMSSLLTWKVSTPWSHIGFVARYVDFYCYICGNLAYIYTFIVEKSTIFGKILYRKRGLD